MAAATDLNSRGDLVQVHLPKLPPDRLRALTDGIFAIALTILVLNIAVPPLVGRTPTEREFWGIVYGLRHYLINYCVSFVLLGVFWLVHHQQTHFIRRTNSWHLWANLAGLLLVCLVPFSTSLMSEYHQLIGAAIVFEANMLLIGLAFYLQWAYATSGRRLVDEDLDESIVIKGRRLNFVLVASSAIASGLAFLHPRYSLLAFTLIPLTFAMFRTRLFMVD